MKSTSKTINKKSTALRTFWLWRPLLKVGELKIVKQEYFYSRKLTLGDCVLKTCRPQKLGQASKTASLSTAMNKFGKGDLVRIRTRALEFALDRSLQRARRIYQLEAEVYTVADSATRYCSQIRTV